MNLFDWGWLRYLIDVRLFIYNQYFKNTFSQIFIFLYRLIILNIQWRRFSCEQFLFFFVSYFVSFMHFTIRLIHQLYVFTYDILIFKINYYIIVIYVWLHWNLIYRIFTRLNIWINLIFKFSWRNILIKLLLWSKSRFNLITFSCLWLKIALNFFTIRWCVLKIVLIGGIYPAVR